MNTKTMQEVIKEKVEELEYSEQKKKEYEEVLNKILIDNVPMIEALNTSPEVLELIYGHAYRLYKSGQYQQASALFSLLITLQPAVQKYHMGLAACFHMQKEYGAAVDSYMAAFYLNMEDPLPFYHIADCLIKSGSNEQAYFSLGMAIEIAGKNPKYLKIKERAQLMQARLTDLKEKELASQPEQTAKGDV